MASSKPQASLPSQISPPSWLRPPTSPLLCSHQERITDNLDGINRGEVPMIGAMTDGYTFRVMNPATVRYLQIILRTEHLATAMVCDNPSSMGNYPYTVAEYQTFESRRNFRHSALSYVRSTTRSRGLAESCGRLSCPV